MADLEIYAKEVRGHCSAGIKVGDKFVLRGANISLTESDRICSFALANLYPAIFAARLGHDLKDLGLTQRTIQCIDPGPPESSGGTVLFEVKTLKAK